MDCRRDPDQKLQNAVFTLTECEILQPSTSRRIEPETEPYPSAVFLPFKEISLWEGAGCFQNSFCVSDEADVGQRCFTEHQPHSMECSQDS